jgi:hypothetical protein
MRHAWGRNAYRFLTGETEGRRRLGRSLYILEDNIMIDVKEEDWGARNGLSCLKIETAGYGEHGNENSVSRKCLEFLV